MHVAEGYSTKLDIYNSTLQFFSMHTHHLVSGRCPFSSLLLVFHSKAIPKISFRGFHEMCSLIDDIKMILEPRMLTYL